MISFKFRNLPILMLLIFTVGVPGVEKILGGGVPAWFLTQFHGSLLDLFPGALVISFYCVAILEILSGGTLLWALLRGEFSPAHPDKRTLRAALILTQLTFVALAFGQRITHKYDDAAQLFAYAVLTFLAAPKLLAKEDPA